MLRTLLRAVDRSITPATGNRQWRQYVLAEFRRTDTQADPAERQRALQDARDFAFLINSVREHKARLKASSERCSSAASGATACAHLRACVAFSRARPVLVLPCRVYAIRQAGRSGAQLLECPGDEPLLLLPRPAPALPASHCCHVLPQFLPAPTLTSMRHALLAAAPNTQRTR